MSKCLLLCVTRPGLFKVNLEPQININAFNKYMILLGSRLQKYGVCVHVMCICIYKYDIYIYMYMIYIYLCTSRASYVWLQMKTCRATYTHIYLIPRRWMWACHHITSAFYCTSAYCTCEREGNWWTTNTCSMMAHRQVLLCKCTYIYSHLHVSVHLMHLCAILWLKSFET